MQLLATIVAAERRRRREKKLLKAYLGADSWNTHDARFHNSNIIQ